MMRLFLPPALACLPIGTLAQDVQRVYQEHCANCHGAQLEGGLGGNLVDEVWRHGADDENIARAIRNGLPDIGFIGLESPRRLVRLVPAD